MTVPSARWIDGKKLMWDGKTYASAEEAARARAGYEADGFETWQGADEAQHLVYTRRVVQQQAAQPH